MVKNTIMIMMRGSCKRYAARKRFSGNKLMTMKKSFLIYFSVITIQILRMGLSVQSDMNVGNLKENQAKFNHPRLMAMGVDMDLVTGLGMDQDKDQAMDQATDQVRDQAMDRVMDQDKVLAMHQVMDQNKGQAMHQAMDQDKDQVWN